MPTVIHSHTPLIFPSEDLGWTTGLQHAKGRRTATRQTITYLQFYSYRLAIRPDVFSPINHARKLFQQYAVDMYVKTEGHRLSYIRNNQGRLRVELYQVLPLLFFFPFYNLFFISSFFLLPGPL